MTIDDGILLKLLGLAQNAQIGDPTSPLDAKTPLDTDTELERLEEAKTEAWHNAESRLEELGVEAPDGDILTSPVEDPEFLDWVNLYQEADDELAALEAFRDELALE